MFDKKSFIHLKKRSLITIHGKDRFSFLQGIISNDTDNLNNNLSIYSSILTPQGRFVTDFFLTHYKDSLIMELQYDDLDLILSKLNMYKLRSDVHISTFKNAKLFLISNDTESILTNSIKESLCYHDPRFKNLFKRFYLFSNEKISLQKEFQLNSLSDQDFNDLRLNNSIPDFNIDAIKNKSLLMEMRFDQLNGISWTKGCYMGQEITARMKYRNLMKKKLYKVELEFNNFLENEIKFEDKIIGTITSCNNKDGLAYFNLKFINEKLNKDLISGDSKIKITEPWWSL